MVTRKFGVADIDKIMEQYRPYTIGFEKVWDNLNTVGELANNYPPYNIIRQDEEHFVIEIAAAGFRKEEFNINLIPSGNKLSVQGIQDRSGEEAPEYLHKGVGARNFTRTFALAEDVDVTGSKFEDGMLIISLEKIIPEEKKTRTIEVE